MRTSLWPSVAVLACAACAHAPSRPTFSQRMNSYVGVTQIDLIRAFGPPAQSYQADGHEFVSYTWATSGVLPGTPPTYKTTYNGSYATTTVKPGVPDMPWTRTCTVVFEIAKSRVIYWRASGDDCN